MCEVHNRTDNDYCNCVCQGQCFIVLFQLQQTPLHISAYNGYEDVVQLLLQQPNIVVDARDMVRVHYGNISIVS